MIMDDLKERLKHTHSKLLRLIKRDCLILLRLFVLVRVLELGLLTVIVHLLIFLSIVLRWVLRRHVASGRLRASSCWLVLAILFEVQLGIELIKSHWLGLSYDELQKVLELYQDLTASVC